MSKTMQKKTRGKQHLKPYVCILCEEKEQWARDKKNKISR